MNIKDSYIHNGTAVLKDIKIENSVLKKILAGKDANDNYLAWTDVLDLKTIKANTAIQADYATYIGNATTHIGVNTSTTGYAAYYSNANTISGTNALFIDADNGRVGIGTTSPEYKLQVNGNMLVKGTVEVDDDSELNVAKSVYIKKGTSRLNYLDMYADLTLDSNKGSATQIIYSQKNYSGSLVAATITSSAKTWTLPDETGTIRTSGSTYVTSGTGYIGGTAITTISGNAGSASKIATITRSTNANHYLTFVDSDNSSSTNELLYTDGGIYYNPSSNTLNISGDLHVGSMIYGSGELTSLRVTGAATFVNKITGSISGTSTGIEGYTFKTSTAATASGWTNNTTDDKIIPTMSFIAYWNGAYSGNSSNITKVGTISNGTWLGTAIANTYIANHSITIAGTSVDLGGSISAATIGNALTSSAPAAYATSAGEADYLTSRYIGTDGDTIALLKAKILAHYTTLAGKTGYSIQINSSAALNFDNDSYVIPASGTYSLTYLTPGYDGQSYGQWLAACLGDMRLYVIGRKASAWTATKTIAWTSDIPTSLPANGGTATYAGSLGSSSASLSYSTVKGMYDWYANMIDTNNDSDAYINRWKEVVDFLNDFTEQDDLASILSKYVTLNTTQTISGAKSFEVPIAGDLLGNATTADRFKNQRTVTFSGNVSGTYTYDGSADSTCTLSIGSSQVSNAMLAGSIANGKLANSSMTIAGTSVSLGGSITADTLKTNLGLGSNAYTSTAYIPLAGSSTSAPITGILYSNTSGLYINSNNADLDIWHIVGNSGSWSSQYGFNLQYLGTGSGNNNDLILWAHHETSTHVEVYRVHQDGTYIFKSTPYIYKDASSNYTILHSGNVSGGGSGWGASITINGTSLTCPSIPSYSDIGAAAASHTHKWANLDTAASASYNTEPEFKTMKLGNGTSSTATSYCKQEYDATNKCLKFIFA